MPSEALAKEGCRRQAGAFETYLKSGSGHALEARIHHFHQGPAREIYNRYATNRLEPAVADAIAEDVLPRETVPPELLEHLAGLIRLFEHGLG
jgi:hypothetical protein